MLASLGRTLGRQISTGLGQQARGFKCCVLGAAGGIGQPLALLLKANPKVSALSLYDIAPITPGVAEDLAHINTKSKCEGFVGDGLNEALKGSDIVVIPAGVPRKPGMTRDDLFNINAGIVAKLAQGVAESCPEALVLIISNPVNSTVPIAQHVLKKKGVFDEKKLFGVTTLDNCRAKTFVARTKGIDPRSVEVSVIGGHAGTTIVPLLSQIKPKMDFSNKERDTLTKDIMFGGDKVVEKKGGGGSATLSMAYAGAHFADRALAAMSGEPDVVENAYVYTNKVAGANFFALPVSLGKDGIKQVHGYGKVNEYEQKLINDMLPDLKNQAEKGLKWAKENV